MDGPGYRPEQAESQQAGKVSQRISSTWNACRDPRETQGPVLAVVSGARRRVLPPLPLLPSVYSARHTKHTTPVTTTTTFLTSLLFSSPPPSSIINHHPFPLVFPASSFSLLSPLSALTALHDKHLFTRLLPRLSILLVLDRRQPSDSRSPSSSSSAHDCDRLNDFYFNLAFRFFRRSQLLLTCFRRASAPSRRRQSRSVACPVTLDHHDEQGHGSFFQTHWPRWPGRRVHSW